MSKKMLIDASHPEETRVVIVNGSQIEELDFESQNKRQLRGNVYLARVTRVEPSLQAAFVEYGGNRHGFLAFSEIHPDYYQIPYEDRMALIEAEEEDNRADYEDDTDNADASSASGEDSNDESGDDAEASMPDVNDPDPEEDAADEADEEVAQEQAKTASTRRKRMSRRRYKIQEVVKRGQILLVQVVKEERGNKGAALTTYLSMAGRYCVLMPNTPRGGGISRKISNASDRKRLKSVVSEFEVPQGMGVIVRTAGAKRTKLEIKRDYDYLCRLWETTRETTLKSIAPALIHEEGNLVKRSIRDLYNKDIDEVLVQGDEAYKTAKSFIKMLMPSHAKNVKAYKEPIPLFLRYQVESQIEDSLDSVVQLKSGGYLVIHPTEALVSVDVNSGRSTKERNVERTALKTNLEAADEVARQMRLRDLAGLIVIDFIDMDENRNNRAVEKRMKDALARDRARVQNSRISQFGLMEISRQRRRRSLLEGSTASCNHCDGVGRKRTIESSALRAIRAVEETGVRGRANRIRLKVAPDVALYIFNEKRDLLTAVDSEFDVFTELVGDDSLIRPAFEVEILEASEDAGPDPLIDIEKELNKLNREAQKAESNARRRAPKDDDEEQDTKPRQKKTSDAKDETPSDDDDGSQKRRRRRGRRGGRRRGAEGETSEDKGAATETTDESKSETGEAEKPSGDKPKRRRRRSRSDKTSNAQSETAPETAEVTQTVEAETKPKSRSTRRRAAPKRAPAKDAVETATETVSEPVKEATDKPKPSRSAGRRKAPSRKPKPEADAPVAEAAPTADADTAEKPKRKRAPRKKTATPAAEAKTETAKATPRRRKAPARKPADTEPEAAKTEAEPAKAAPKAKAKPKTAPVKAAATKRAPARRKAPARKPKADAQAEVAPAAKPAAKKKAAPKPKPKPKPKAAAKPAVAAKPAPKADTEPKLDTAAAAEPQKKSEDKPVEPKKKKGWLGRLLKD